MARLAACLLLVSSAILATSPVLGQGIQQGAVVRFSPPSLEIDLPKDHIVLSYKDWLGSRGVMSTMILQSLAITKQILLKLLMLMLTNA